MISLDEKRKIEYFPGDIIYADSNFARRYDCFGVVVDRAFWVERMKKEGFLIEAIKDRKGHVPFDEKVPFRVLGTKIFSSENSDGLEPYGHKVMYYRFQHPHYVSPVNLRPIIELSKIDNSRVGRLLFSDYYMKEVIEDAEVIYDYLDGKRFDKSKLEKREFINHKDKLLRLLEQAIPQNR